MTAETEEQTQEKPDNKLNDQLQEALATLRDPNQTVLDIREIPFSKEHYDAIAAELPNSSIKHLTLGEKTARYDNIGGLLEVLPECEQLESLNISGLRVQEDTLTKLTEVIPKTGISSLHFVAHSDTPKPSCDFLDMLEHSQVTDLRYSTMVFAEEEAQHMAQALKKGQITKLDVTHGTDRAKTTKVLTEALPETNLTSLRMHNGHIKTDNATLLAEALPHSKLTNLDLPYNEIDNPAAEKIFAALPDTEIKNFRVADNPISFAGLHVLASALPDTKIQSLDLSQVYCPEAFNELADALPHSEVSALTLQKSSISALNMKKMAEVLPQCGLQSLVLSDNPFTNAGAIALSEGLPCSELSELKLDRCDISSMGVKALAKALPASQLVSVSLLNTQITEDGMDALAEAVPESSLAHVDYYLSSASQNAVDQIAASTQANWQQAQQMAQKLVESPKTMAPEDWQEAAKNINGLRFAIQQASKRLGGNALEPAQIDAKLAETFSAIAESEPIIFQQALLKILPCAAAIEEIKAQDSPLCASNLLDDKGHFPSIKSFRGNAGALFADPCLWENEGQIRNAHASLHEQQKAGVTTLHQLCAVVSSATAKDRGR